MANNKAPLFRNSMHGYNREDVNSYIIAINRSMEENRKMYEKALSECNANAESNKSRITELLESNNTLEKENNALLERVEMLEKAEQASIAREEELVSLRLLVNELEEKLAAYEAVDAEDRSKAEHYDSICSKAGEILVIASSTAEDILNRANSEALKIVGDANSKKDLMLKTFSESVDAAACDINTYIRTAVDTCVKKINKSVKEVSNIADAEGSKKPGVVFVKNSNVNK